MKFYSQALLAPAEPKPTAAFAAGLNLRDHVRSVQEKGRQIYEFIGTGDFGTEWNTRRRYEVDAGRVEVPILYTPIYEPINDASLPQYVPVSAIGPAGVAFEEVLEGGEVKFATVGGSDRTVAIRHFGVGLEYNKDLVVYNQLWTAAIVERQVGRAYNALQNYLHLNPILAASYGAANQSAAVTTGATDEEDIVLTLEAAMTAARTDTSNPRPGPYSLLCSSAQGFRIERALTRVPQVGTTRQSSAIDAIQEVIFYDGWSGTRGNKTVSYSGVTSGKAYLIDKSNRLMFFQSYVKQGLDQAMGNSDVSRFILDQIVWDCYQGVYANVLAATEEITLP